MNGNIEVITENLWAVNFSFVKMNFISINASEPVQEADSSVNWYEVIKIVLLAILVINMLWKPRQKDLP